MVKNVHPQITSGSSVHIPKHLQRIVFFIYCLFFFVPLTFSNSVVDTGAIHRLLFSILTFVLLAVIAVTVRVVRTIHLHRSFFWLSISFPLMLLISSLGNRVPELLFADLSQIAGLMIFAYITMMMCTIFDKQYFIKRVAVCISIAGGLAATIGILQAFSITSINIPMAATSGATLGGSSFASEYLAGVIPWMILTAVLVQRKSAKNLTILGITITVTYVMLLRSRAAYLALLITIVALAWHYMLKLKRSKSTKKDYHPLLTAAAVICIAVSIGFLQPRNTYNRSFTETVQNMTLSSPYSTSRLKFWSSSFEMFVSSPVIGIGTGRWVCEYSKYRGPDYTDQNIYKFDSINPHNDFLEILSENGMIGFLSYSLIIVFALRKLLWKSDEGSSSLLIGMSLLNIVVVSVFAFPKDRIAPMTLFYLAIGIAYFSPKSRDSMTMNLRSVAMVFTLVSMLTVYFVYLWFQDQRHYYTAIQYKMAENYSGMLEHIRSIDRNRLPLDPSGLPIAYYLGVGYFQLGDFFGAQKYFEDARELIPYNPLVLNNLASSSYMCGKNMEAKQIYTEMKTKYPNYIEPQINLLSVLANSGEDSSAIILLNELEENASGNATYHQIKDYYAKKSR
ncbi:MAG: O-antigen ligase family protein [Bacteroidetes bacterium]|nr:O-antigen ligase family protein [Bacteroidota bacterium]